MRYRKLGLFITERDIVEDTIDLCKILRKVIPEFDVVVAIPRGGILPAAIISDKFAKPLSTPDLLLRNECWWTSSVLVDGHRDYYSMDTTVKLNDISNLRIILVDDTSTHSLGTLEKVKRMFLEKYPNMKIYKISIYARKNTVNFLDLYCKYTISMRRVEKDILIRKGSDILGFDMDGVLCENCPYEVVIDDEKYNKWLLTATPYLIPHYKINFIITARLEKYRKETEEWLNINNVKYDKLIMQEGTDKRTGTDHALYKAKIIKRLLPDGIYFESSLNQAKKIFELSGVQVICIESLQLIGSGLVEYKYHPLLSGIRKNKEYLLEDKFVPVVTTVKKKKSTWLFKDVELM